MSRRYARVGLSLIETLAVVVLLALSASVVATALRGGATDPAGDSELVKCVSRVDRRARLESLGRRPVAIVLAGDELAVRAEPRGELLFREKLPRGSRLRFRVKSADSDGIIFDRAGRCSDYEVELGGQDGETLRVSGATGWSVLVHSEE